MDRTLKSAIHKAWESAHKQGEAIELDALISVDIADESAAKQMLRHEIPSRNNQHHTQAFSQRLGNTGAPAAIEKALEIPSAARSEETLCQSPDR
jgi:hypothetical protein